ncbi:MAG TPA: hypothetical protein H9799_00655 [Candidatus Mediterraneibacter merdipullorum]|nr:hypothetical protein [Candidatus Mediterraneibacter merdipullorum]
MRDKDGQLLELKLEDLPKKNSADTSGTGDIYGISFDDLDKYGPEGYEYVYVVREYLSGTTADGDPADHYEQVFGRVEASGDGDASVTDVVDTDGEVQEVTGERTDKGNTFVYDNGPE